jgi:hypothetical protein
MTQQVGKTDLFHSITASGHTMDLKTLMVFQQLYLGAITQTRKWFTKLWEPRYLRMHG